MASRRIICSANSLAALRPVAFSGRQYSSSSKQDDVQTVTHTGQVKKENESRAWSPSYKVRIFFHSQVFEPSDYRNVRFTNSTRYVNKKWGKISTRNLRVNRVCDSFVLWMIFRYRFGERNSTERSDRTCCLVQWRRRTFRTSKSFHQFGKIDFVYSRRFRLMNQLLVLFLQDKPGDHTCGYCGLRFVKKEDHHWKWKREMFNRFANEIKSNKFS